ncbi:MAG: response regulator [Oscillospiraceae bacterium]|jgi:two-component system response regulator YesN|nr:response regulator [Oscillospiraceae bacterium]
MRIYKYIVAEDEPLIRRNVLKKIGALNLPFAAAGDAGDGATALKLVEEHLPHIVITDIRMPVMDGLTLAHHLYENHPQVHCIILSGYDDFKYAQEAIKYNVNDFLLKPVKPEELKKALHRVLLQLDAEHQSQDELQIQGESAEELNTLLVDYLRANYRTDISLGRLAEQFGFSQEYLTKTFKKYNQDTPLKYIGKLRIASAKQLLLNEPGMEIKKIGEYVGYPDSFYFSRVFKSNTGEYPSEYRTRMLKQR